MIIGISGPASFFRIHDLLKHRSKYAATIANIYLFASNLLSYSEKKIQVCLLNNAKFYLDVVTGILSILVS